VRQHGCQGVHDTLGNCGQSGRRHGLGG
jgi:hypothetical protein